MLTNIVVPFTVGILGPSSYDMNSSGSWSVNIPAGTAPFSYEWYVDDQATGVTADTYGGGVGDTGAHVLRVNVTDSAGHWSSASKVINVTGSGCSPTAIVC